MPQQRSGFTKQQLYVLKAQILAFQRLKKREGTFPQERLRSIALSPLESQLWQAFLPTTAINQDKSVVKKIIEINPYMLGIVAGRDADFQFWHRNLSIKCRLHELTNERGISATGVSKQAGSE